MKAAKSLAQMFNGQIVNQEDDVAIPQDAGEFSALEQSELSLDEPEPDDDEVPF